MTRPSVNITQWTKSLRLTPYFYKIGGWDSLNNCAMAWDFGTIGLYYHWVL